MSEPLPILDQSALPSLCRMLRTKNAYGYYGDDEEPWQTNESTTAVYWCLATMDTAGPDDNFCHPTTCREGRACYRKDE